MPQLTDGEVTAFEGVVRVGGEPMTSPLTETPCAARNYELSDVSVAAIRILRSLG